MSHKRPRIPKYHFKVKRSSAGLGLFTKDLIKKDSFVIEYFGPLITADEADEKGGRYLFDIDKKWTIDGTSRKNLARYLNHSCKPNCEAEIDGRRLFIYAIKDIETGEELTYHYGKEYFEDFIKPVGCKCGHHQLPRNKLARPTCAKAPACAPRAGRSASRYGRSQIAA